jgi:hypothetical protein
VLGRGQGKPSAKERAIFAAAVVFLYGVWENYVEQLAIELVRGISSEAKPDRIPDIVRKQLEKKSAWELTISPGWRALWVQSVTVNAVGDDEERFGLNTAKAGQVTHLLSTAGSSAPFSGALMKIIPEHVSGSATTVAEAVNLLVELRGEIVHTGQVPLTLRKHHVLGWETFVKSLCDAVDATARSQCASLVQ